MSVEQIQDLPVGRVVVLCAFFVAAAVPACFWAVAWARVQIARAKEDGETRRHWDTCRTRTGS